jgi:hypothetical protein
MHSSSVPRCRLGDLIMSSLDDAPKNRSLITRSREYKVVYKVDEVIIS